MPDEWVQSEGTTEFFGDIASAPLAVLMLDYDGTLAPFTADRLHANPYPGVKDRLQRLVTLPRTRVILISGRNARELHDLLDLGAPIEIWGSHGREHLCMDGSYEMVALTSYEQAGLQQVRQALEAEFSADVVEVKPNSIAAHWRHAQQDDGSIEQSIRNRMTKLCRDLPPARTGDGSLQLLAFDGGLELRAGTITKGDAVKRILEQFPPGTPVAFLGDDITDEDAFAVLRERGLAVLVKHEPRETLARLWLTPPEDLLIFLDAWIDAVESRL